MLDAHYSHLYFCQSLNRLQRGLSAIAELLVCSDVPLRYYSLAHSCIKLVLQSLISNFCYVCGNEFVVMVLLLKVVSHH